MTFGVVQGQMKNAWMTRPINLEVASFEAMTVVFRVQLIVDCQRVTL